MKKILLIVIPLLLILFVGNRFLNVKKAQHEQELNEQSQIAANKAAVESTRKLLYYFGSELVGYDWAYPDMNDPMATWKFSNDGTFSTSQIAFGGSSRYGKWKYSGNKSKEDYPNHLPYYIELIYDGAGFVLSGDGESASVEDYFGAEEGVDVRDTITLLSKSQFQLGSTVYRRY